MTEAGGTAKQAAIDGLPVAGKTGTAQKVGERALRSRQVIASFVGVVPAEEPRLAIAVMMDEPQGAHLGGAVAAPVFKADRGAGAPVPARAAERDRGSKTPARAAGKDPKRAPADGDDAAAEGPATDLPVGQDNNDGDDPALAEQWDQVAGAEGVHDAGDADGDGPHERVVVPNFVGLSLGQAIRTAHRSGVELAFDDPDGRATGIALRQRPTPGPAAAGVICRVAFGRRE